MAITPKKALRFSIRHRIFGSFVFVLLIGCLVTAINIVGLQDVDRYFHQFKQDSADTNLMLKIDKNVSDLQRHILAFSNTEKGATSEQLYSLRKQLLLDIEQLLTKESHGKSAHRAQLEQMKRTAESFAEKIESLEKERAFRELLVLQHVGAHFDELNTTLNSIFLLSEKHNSDKPVITIWNAQQHISAAETLSGRYFLKREFQLRQRVIQELHAATAQLKSLTPKREDSSTARELSTAVQLLDKTLLLFNKAVQADRNYLFLVNVVIAGETAELNNLSESLKNATLNEQSQLFITTEKHIDWIVQFDILISIMGAIIAAIVAMITGAKISQPLQSITDTFSRLVSGETVAEIPGMNRNDEIGQLALAANIFRENNAKTQQLLTHTEQLASDLTQREKALELAVAKAQDANLAKSQFLANMSHELRTPMNAILGMLFLLQKTDLNSRQADYATKTEGAARSLLSLLNDILDLSKAEAGKMELDPVPFTLAHVFRDLNVILATNLIAKPVELHFSVGDGVPQYFVGDALRLKQVLINLGGNAIKFTERGSVVISVTQTVTQDEQPTLTFSVRDSGIGIAAESQEKIFSSFTQAEASTTRRFGGTGLGLAISQRLVALMGGELMLDSELGKGSCFYFSIKLPQPSADDIKTLTQQVENTALTLSGARLKDMRLLLVEDNLTNQQIAVELLEAEGAKVQVANHGQEAVDILARNLHTLHHASFDVVLMDLQMPVMDGMTATKEIRNRLNLFDLPIIAMTANAMTSDREACLNASMNDHIGKPFDIHDVIQILRKHAGWKTIEESQTENTPMQAAIISTAASAHPQSDKNAIAEIDLKSALSRMGGNKDLYLRMLPKFIDSLNAQPTQLRAAIANGDLHGASRLLHSLKGLSSTMGVTHIAAEAARGEKILLKEISIQEASEFIESFLLLIENQLPYIGKIENML